MSKRVNGGKSEYAKHLRPVGKRLAAKQERKAASHTIKIENGRLSFVYDDALADLLTEGAAIVNRVSHVEPAPTGGWTADMAPVDGPVLGPFKTRAEGLAAERAWLTEHKGL